MKGFKKLALASAVAALPVSGFAMEAMNDEALSDVTGQDGITISLGNDISTDIIIHDVDGFSGPGTTVATDSGQIILSGVSITRNATTDTIDIDIDAGVVTAGGTGVAGAAGDEVLNIGITIPNNLSVALGNVQVGDSSRTALSSAAAGWGADTSVSTVLNLGTITMGTTNMNIQLGAEPQGNMIVMDTVITGGITLSNFAINDANSGGAISMASLTILDNGGANLTVDLGIDATATALDVTVNTLGSTATGADIRIVDLVLGGGAPIGDVEITGLDLTGTISISGH